METTQYKLTNELLIANLQLYPKAEIRDIYKLLYQTFHGAGHAFFNAEEARENFYLEWNRIKINESRSPLSEPIYIEGFTPKLYRLNFVPAGIAGIDPEIILGLFTEAAQGFPKNHPITGDLHLAFMNTWIRFGEDISNKLFPFAPPEYRKFTSEMSELGWPPARHSGIYRLVYQPHYRLVSNTIFSEK